jgi:hypothetical protein
LIIPPRATTARADSVPSFCDDLPPPRNPSDVELRVMDALVIHGMSFCNDQCIKIRFQVLE